MIWYIRLYDFSYHVWWPMLPFSLIFIKSNVLSYHFATELDCFLYDVDVLGFKTKWLHQYILRGLLSIAFALLNQFYLYFFVLFLMRLRLGFVPSSCFFCTGWVWSFFFTERGLGPFAILVLIWIPLSEEICFILSFFSCYFFAFWSWTISSISFSWGSNLFLISFSRWSNLLLWISSIVTLWSGPKYITGTFPIPLRFLRNSISWEQTIYCL